MDRLSLRITGISKFACGLTLIVAGVLVPAGCQTPPAKQETAGENPAFQEWETRATQRPAGLPEREPLPGASELSAQDMSGLGRDDEAPMPSLPSLPVNDLVMTRDVELPVLLRALADAADLNILIGTNVRGPVRINLRSKTQWDRLFLAIIKDHGLHYEWDDDLLRVMAQADIERQIAMEQVLRERQQATKERKGNEPMTVELYRVQYANVDRLAASVNNTMASDVLTAIAPTAVIADDDSGLLIIHATPANAERARTLARALDQPARQVLIEATIVQANSETARELGFQWGMQHSGADRGRVTLGTTANPDGFNSNFPAGFSPGDPGFLLGAQRISSHQILQAQLSAMQRDGRLNIVSSPSITTLDKQLATIEAGEERPFQSATGTGVGAISRVEFKKAVLRLEVTPQVIDGKWIKLSIDTTKDEFDDSQAVRIEDSLQVPIITRAASTMLYLEDGETTVIGGLSTESQTDSITGVPFLKDLPLLGGLFRSSTNRTALSDTLIFITPYLLDDTVTP